MFSVSLASLLVMSLCIYLKFHISINSVLGDDDDDGDEEEGEKSCVGF
jgi:hypothetical protein